MFGRLSMSSATCLTSSPATTRSTTASAWPAGRVAIKASAARVEASSRTVAAGSSGADGSGRLVSGSSWTGLRAARRHPSRALCRAMVNTQARNAASSPWKRPIPLITATQVSAARSSAAPGAITLK